MAGEGFDRQPIQGLRDAEEVRKLLRLSMLLRTVRAELKPLNFDKATEPELNQVKDRILEILRRAVSGSTGQGLGTVLRP